VKAEDRRAAVDQAKARGLSVRRGSALVKLSRSSYYYKPHPRDNAALCGCLRKIADEEKRYGYRRAWDVVNKSGVLSGERVNRKRVHRLWRLLGLQLPRRKPRKKKTTKTAGPPVKAACPNHVWTYDFMFDSLSNGRRIKLLTVEDEFTREGLAIHVAHGITAADVICILADLFERYGPPAFIRSDNGPEFIAEKLKTWLAARGTQTLYIEKGCPWQNGFIESFNSKTRDEHLNMEIFLTLREAQVKTEMWRVKYNTKRPHSSLGYRTPDEERKRFFAGAPPPTPRSFSL
jgi:transposase InsO family protein